MFISKPIPTHLTYDDVLLETQDPAVALNPDFTIESHLVDGAPATTVSLGSKAATFRLAEVDPSQLQDESVGYADGKHFAWTNAQGLPLSSMFELPSPPARVLSFDPDGDGDDDLFIECEDGSTFISFALYANMQKLTLESDETALTPDVWFWLEGVSGAEACFSKADALQILKFLLLPSVIREKIGDILSDDAVVAPQITMYERATNNDEEEAKLRIEKQEAAYFQRWDQTLKPLLESANQIFSNLTLQSEHHAGEAGCSDLWGSIIAHIQTAQSSILLFTTAAGNLPNAFGLMEAGIGIAYDGSSIPQGFVVVGDVLPDSSAGRAGIKKGDRIVSVNGQPVGQFADPEEALKRKTQLEGQIGPVAFNILLPEWPFLVATVGPYGSTVNLEVSRGGEKREIEVKRTFNLMPLWFDLEYTRFLEESHPEMGF